MIVDLLIEYIGKVLPIVFGMECGVVNIIWRRLFQTYAFKVADILLILV